MDTHSLQVPRIALLIDFDNVILGVEEPPGFDIELVVNALRSRGVIVLGRAYGDWYRHHRHRRKLMDHGIELVETPAFGPIIKNSADIRIALDGFEIGMTQHHITEFCLVSGDSDFLPLIKRLQYLGKTVTVISGVKFTSELVRRNCNEFISYENLLAESVGATEDATTLEGSFTLLTRTIHTLHERGMEVRSSTVKQMMIQLNPVFSERTFGCSQFKQFLDKACRAELIKLGNRDPNSGEYNVLLPGDTDDEPIVAEETAKATRPSRRVRGRRFAAAEEASGEETPVVAEGSEEAAATPEEQAAEAPARAGTSRLGRLRSSGRTWKSGKAVTRSILQGALNGQNAAADEAEAQTEPSAEAEVAPEPQGEEVAAATPAQLPLDIPEAEAPEPQAEAVEVKEAEGAEVAEADEAVAEAVADAPAVEEEKPKRAPRRRKPAAKKKAEPKAEGDEAKPASEEAPVVAEAQPQAPVSEAGADAPAEAAQAEAKEEKKAAKKPTRRRKPAAKKKEEAAAPPQEPAEG